MEAATQDARIQERRDGGFPCSVLFPTRLRVLVACEYSGSVRDAFAALGHDAMSCDLLPSDRPGKHHQGDVRLLLSAPIPKIALENPVSIISSKIRKPDQVIQPWQFGHGETKATCLWLKNLPKLKPTNIVAGREGRVWKLPPSPDRWKLRSLTFSGIARAMAEQWSVGKEKLSQEEGGKDSRNEYRRPTPIRFASSK